MKRILVTLFLVALALGAHAQGKGAAAPGQDPSFYRGITTLDPVVVTELVTEATSSSVTETRTIGGGQLNNGKDGNLQDRTVTTTTTVVKKVTTTTVNSHRGAPNSNGKALEPVVTVTTEVVSSSTVTTVGDWGPAYSVPSDSK